MLERKIRTDHAWQLIAPGAAGLGGLAIGAFGGIPGLIGGAIAAFGGLAPFLATRRNHKRDAHLFSFAPDAAHTDAAVAQDLNLRPLGYE
jgi:hypothetical protein